VSVDALNEVRADWLAWRKAGIGGSDIAAVLGLSPWGSPWTVWADKLGFLPEQPDDAGILEAGRWLELAIGPWTQDRLGLFVSGEQRWCVHTENDWMRCTIDGVLSESPGAIWPPETLLEIKTSGPGAVWDDVPPHYRSQVLWQMAVTGAQAVVIARLAGRRLDHHWIERDAEAEADIAFMVEAGRAFWFDHVLTEVPPPVDASDATSAVLGALHPRHAPDTGVDLDADLVEHWRAAKAAAKAADEQVRLCENAIKAALGDREVGRVDGNTVCTWRTSTRTSLDTKALAAAEPELAKRFERTTEVRTLRASTKKGD